MGQEMLYISLAKHTHIHTDIQTQPCSDFLGHRSAVYLNVITVVRWCIYTNIIITGVPVRRGPEGAMPLVSVSKKLCHAGTRSHYQYEYYALILSWNTTPAGEWSAERLLRVPRSGPGRGLLGRL